LTSLFVVRRARYAMASHEVRPSDAAKSYFYVRIGLVSAAVLLAVSVGVEIWQVTRGPDGFCLQTSISAYYYTPVRAVFVGSLLMVSLALIAIQGDKFEDLFLTLAGMMAPVVALVPTPSEGHQCSSTTQAPFAVEAVDNNVLSLLLIGWALWLLAGWFLKPWKNVAPLSARVGWLVVFVFLVGYSLSFRFSREFFDGWAHNVSAIAMFVFLFFATYRSAYRCRTRFYANFYWVLALMMVAVFTGVLLGRVTGWGHWVFTLEASEILIFAVYWLVQTIEHRPPSAASLAKPPLPQPEPSQNPIEEAWKKFKTKEPSNP
jgi:hypothetical protein